MAKPLDEDLSATATSSDAGSGTNTAQHPLHGSDALDWATKSFGFDLNRTGTQPGVEDLQKWLLSNDKSVTPDGVWGPQTLRAMEEAYSEGLSAERVEVGSEAPSSGFDKAPPGSFAQQARVDEPEPTPTPAPADEDVSAQPVALSDSAIEDISQDRLGFRPYVEAVAEFILAKQTRPPLAVAINARWGQGKTSFMKLLEKQLKSEAEGTKTRIGTTWFNPWKYSEPAQVWAAFVANVTRCLQDNLTPEQSRQFKWGRFKQKWHRHADLAFVLRLLVAAAFLILVIGIAFTMKWTEFTAWSSQGNSFLSAAYKALSASLATGWGYLLIGPFALLALIYGYVTFAKKLGLNLLEYVEKTDFKDKIGTLSQFEDEMQRLAKAVPEDLKVVVFIDDLDRCKGRVLGEIIEALQLAEVSHTCVFVMGMDMHIVANAIETERAELAQSAGSAAQMEHSVGYKFLEKIIQARLTLPAHDKGQMENLVTAAMATSEPPGDRASESTPPREQSGGDRPPNLAARVRKGLGMDAPEEREPPSDSEVVISTAKHYGSGHFNNPRRLKRFINGFRLQSYLTEAVRPGKTSVDRLARFLVLAEKWPAVVNYMLEHELGSLGLMADEADLSTNSIKTDIASLPKEDKEQLFELLDGRNGKDHLTADELKDLADWYGFDYYRSARAAAAPA
ncbi:KAP family P-loop NTPase fold protein [Pelagibius marinus]|uniref:KAP family P-loop NTPase fold protein n=1 Tax=Pelagibius marinus TaxID=2762760 RepID=UPI001872AA7F|nr:P-loop NTPase fold protein [Pelagibius marinus]